MEKRKLEEFEFLTFKGEIPAAVKADLLGSSATDLMIMEAFRVIDAEVLSIHNLVLFILSEFGHVKTKAAIGQAATKLIEAGILERAEKGGSFRRKTSESGQLQIAS